MQLSLRDFLRSVLGTGEDQKKPAAEDAQEKTANEEETAEDAAEREAEDAAPDGAAEPAKDAGVDAEATGDGDLEGASEGPSDGETVTGEPAKDAGEDAEGGEPDGPEKAGGPDQTDEPEQADEPVSAVDAEFDAYTSAVAAASSASEAEGQAEAGTETEAPEAPKKAKKPSKAGKPKKAKRPAKAKKPKETDKPSKAGRPKEAKEPSPAEPAGAGGGPAAAVRPAGTDRPAGPDRTARPDRPAEPDRTAGTEEPKAAGSGQKKPEEPKKERTTGRQRKKRKKRRKSKNYLLRIFVAAIIIAALYGVMHLDYFTVNKVSVEGNDFLTEKQVLKGTEIKKGNNIFDVHFVFEKRKILENLYVENVSLKRDLPDRIIVTVKERTGLAQFAMGEKYVVIDNTGRVIEVAKERRDITMVLGFQVIDAQQGQQVKLRKDKGFDKVMALIAAADANDMFFKYVELEDTRLKATIYGKLRVKGSYKNVMDSLESGTLKTVVYDLYQKGKKKGTIIVSGDNYCSFTEKK